MPLGAHRTALMGVAGVATGDVVLLSSQTVADTTSVTFNSGITSAYKEYIFRFYNMHAETNDQALLFQANAVGASGYNEIIQSNWLQSYHSESDSASAFQIDANRDQQLGTGYHNLVPALGTDNDECAAGELHIFDPSSTVYVKHFMSRMVVNGGSNNCQNIIGSGYFNITGAIDDINFKLASGNVSGTIKMWGVKV